MNPAHIMPVAGVTVPSTQQPQHLPAVAPSNHNSSMAAATMIGTKRPLPADVPPEGKVGNGQELSEKKLRRLEKNRLSARECRRRKREATEQMERQINVLESENLRLRLQLQVCLSLSLSLLPYFLPKIPLNSSYLLYFLSIDWRRSRRKYFTGTAKGDGEHG